MNLHNRTLGHSRTAGHRRTFIGVTSLAHLDGVGVSLKAFDVGERLHVVGEPRKTSAADGLYAEAFHEVRGGKPATHARPAAGGQDVIAAAGVITERLGGPGAKENRAGRVDFFDERGGGQSASLQSDPRLVGH